MMIVMVMVCFLFVDDIFVLHAMSIVGVFICYLSSSSIAQCTSMDDSDLIQSVNPLKEIKYYHCIILFL